MAQVGILRDGHRGAKMRSALIFPRFAESTTMKKLFQPLLLLIAGAIRKELSRQVATSRSESFVPQCPPQTGFPISDPSPKKFDWRLVIPI